MILLLTNSLDVTTDRLLAFMPEQPAVFRFNIDLWRDYAWSITADGYELCDPTGRCCREAEVGAVYERKVMFNPPAIDTPAIGSPESWLRAEVFQIWAAIKDLAMGAGKLALIHPSPSGNWYKPRQMRLAQKYFPVLPWQMLHATAPQIGPDLVCKTNTGAPMGSTTNFRVSRVQAERLDISYPWFLQVAGQAASEVTVAYIAGKLFAAEMPRCDAETMDSRQAMIDGHAEWRPCELSPDETERILAMMRETGLSFARFDFLRTEQGLSFLEFNPNGQFGWIDWCNERGMFSAVVDEILRVHSLHFPL